MQDTLLGKPVTYTATYDPQRLVAIFRQTARQQIHVAAPPAALPFHGSDFWTAYEVSWLDAHGKPEVAQAHFSVPATSPALLESKACKLYFNGLNQTRFETPDAVQRALQGDLSAAAGAPVCLRLQLRGALPPARRRVTAALFPAVCLDSLPIRTTTYNVEPAFLQVVQHAPPVRETLLSHLFRSVCPVTGQPDWGCVLVRYAGPPLEHAGLLRYLISYRCHRGFHEQCIEQIFMDIQRCCAPSLLSVYGRFTRRGGLDINPFRSNHAVLRQHRPIFRQ